jgi:hypothetical protein
VITELIYAEEVAKRVGCDKTLINKLARDGHLSRDKWRKFPWPQAQEEFNAYQEGRKTKHKILKQQEGHTPLEKEDLPVDTEGEETEKELSPYEQRKKDLAALSLGEKIVFGLQRRIEGTQDTAYNWGRALNENIKARQAMLELLEKEGKTLKYQDVENWLANTSRQNRDKWLSWPQRVSTEIAEELGVDARLVNDILLRHVKAHLEKIAELPEHFGNG